MTTTNTRRELFHAAAASAAVTLIGASTTDALAYQGNMERTLGLLQEAFGSLQAATPNKGGHRERAMNQVQMGIDFANAHGGG